ncbi:hypothetical protein FRX31_027114 [Thalictrum thalictroides]|uniref:Uncharacterized protein n=1 Tax=Thalictrum thalictroides TaxID=46969 RepID=A0A7J6VEX4_THATH|nr:hypothetical protein FRX31_027114 [Thalictrum thalictroides]
MTNRTRPWRNFFARRRAPGDSGSGSHQSQSGGWVRCARGEAISLKRETSGASAPDHYPSAHCEGRLGAPVVRCPRLNTEFPGLVRQFLLTGELGSLWCAGEWSSAPLANDSAFSQTINDGRCLVPHPMQRAGNILATSAEAGRLALRPAESSRVLSKETERKSTTAGFGSSAGPWRLDVAKSTVTRALGAAFRRPARE